MTAEQVFAGICLAAWLLTPRERSTGRHDKRYDRFTRFGTVERADGTQAPVPTRAAANSSPVVPPPASPEAAA